MPTFQPSPFRKNRLQGFRYAAKGLRIAFATQPNFRIHCLAAVFALALNVILQVSAMEWVVITIAIAMVLVAEILNSSLEFLGDAISTEYHEAIGKAKDLGAAAVLVSAIAAAILGLVVYVPKIMGIRLRFPTDL